MDEPESDYHNFSQSSEAHRLPTLNGAQALLNAIEKHRPISTNLPTLNSILCESDTTTQPDGGVLRGSVTEMYGPPGCGKTHFAMQLAANVLRRKDDARVVWIDTASELPYPRLQEFLDAPSTDTVADEESTQEVTNGSDDPPLAADQRFGYLYIRSLTHLVSVLIHPSKDLIPYETALLVVDDFSGIVMNGLPQDERLSMTAAKDDRPLLSRESIISKSIATRRAAMLSAISAGLARLAATRNLAAIVLNKATSNRKLGGKNATLRSVLSSQQWNENIATRIVLYRVFWPKIDLSKMNRFQRKKQRQRETHALRVAEVERIGGKDVRVEGVKFVILKNRLQPIDPSRKIQVSNITFASSPPLPVEDNEEAMGNLGLDDIVGGIVEDEHEDQSIRVPEDMPSSSIPPTSSPPAKRKIAEIADSEDEDEYEVKNVRSKLPRASPIANGFLPSSQILKSQEEPGTAEEKVNQQESGAEGREDEDGEMLLKD